MQDHTVRPFGTTWINMSVTHGSMAANQTSLSARVYVSSFALYFSCSLNVLISTLAILGNSLVLIAFFRTAKIRKCQTNYLIASLAIADLIVGVVNIPTWIYLNLTNFAAFRNGDPLYLVYTAFDIFSGAASIEHLMFISLERYFAIVWPVIHHLATPTTYGIVITCIWIISIVFSCTFFQGPRLIEHYSIVNAVLIFGIPFAIIIFSYLSILRSIIRRTISRGSLERELKVACTILILVVLFVITWCPFFVMQLVSNQCPSCISTHLVIFLKCIHYSNSFCNPIVYAARVPDFRTAFGQVLSKKFLRLITCRLKPSEHRERASRDRTSSALSAHTSIAEVTENRRQHTILDDTADEVNMTPPRDSVLSALSTPSSLGGSTSLLGSKPPADSNFYLTSV